MNTFKLTLRDGSPQTVEAEGYHFEHGWIHFTKLEQSSGRSDKVVRVASFNEQSVQWIGRVKP